MALVWPACVQFAEKAVTWIVHAYFCPRVPPKPNGPTGNIMSSRLQGVVGKEDESQGIPTRFILMRPSTLSAVVDPQRTIPLGIWIYVNPRRGGWILRGSPIRILPGTVADLAQCAIHGYISYNGYGGYTSYNDGAGDDDVDVDSKG